LRIGNGQLEKDAAVGIVVEAIDEDAALVAGNAAVARYRTNVRLR
jgi:hypothetical protein